MPHEIDYLRDKYAKIGEDGCMVQTVPAVQVSLTRPGKPGFLCKPHSRKQTGDPRNPMGPLMKSKWTYSQKNL